MIVAEVSTTVPIDYVESILLLKPQVSVTMTQRVLVVGVVDVGVVDTRYGIIQPGADAER